MQTDSWEIVAKDNWRAFETFRAGTVHAAPPDDANLAEPIWRSARAPGLCITVSLFIVYEEEGGLQNVVVVIETYRNIHQRSRKVWAKDSDANI